MFSEVLFYVSLILVILFPFAAKMFIKSSIEQSFTLLREHEIEKFKNQLARDKDRDIEELKSQLASNVETLKAQLLKDNETHKKDLNIEIAKTKLVNDSQKEAFRKIIISLDEVMKKLNKEWNQDSKKYTKLLSNEDYLVFNSSIVVETLYIPSAGWRALNYFLKLLMTFVYYSPNQPYPDARILRLRQEEMSLILDDLHNHFRTVTGLCDIDRPLHRTELLICLGILNFPEVAENGFPQSHSFFVDADKTIGQKLSIAETHLDELLMELKQLSLFLREPNNVSIREFLFFVDESGKYLEEYIAEKNNRINRGILGGEIF